MGDNNLAAVDRASAAASLTGTFLVCPCQAHPLIASSLGSNVLSVIIVMTDELFLEMHLKLTMEVVRPGHKCLHFPLVFRDILLQHLLAFRSTFLDNCEPKFSPSVCTNMTIGR